MVEDGDSIKKMDKSQPTVGAAAGPSITPDLPETSNNAVTASDDNQKKTSWVKFDDTTEQNAKVSFDMQIRYAYKVFVAFVATYHVSFYTCWNLYYRHTH